EQRLAEARDLPGHRVGAAARAPRADDVDRAVGELLLRRYLTGSREREQDARQHLHSHHRSPPERSVAHDDSLSRRRSILPVAVCGSASRNSTIRGTLYGVSRVLQNSAMSASRTRPRWPSLRTTQAFTASPR